MQSPTQSQSRTKPVSTATQEQPLDTQTEAQPAPKDSNEQKEKDKPAAPIMTETVTTQENGTEVQPAETNASLPGTQAVENEPAVQPQTEPSVNSVGIETDSASKPSTPSELVPATTAKSKCDAKKAKKTDKGVREPKKYIPSKKAMVDPLKMDMSKPPVIPLTSSQLSLQCLECHIIFSDLKSKERHLKLSHPAEYEQCILRNSLFACYVCDRHFTNSTDLMVHQKAHPERKPFKCPICGLAFNKSSELTFHKKNHYGQDGYECTDCGKNCKTMTLLKYHLRKHSGERPYVCKECGKRFTMSKALQKHMVAHFPEGEGGDPTADPLKKGTGASSVKHPCFVCKATFKSTKTRQHHMKTKHNMLPAAAISLDQDSPVMDGTAPQETQEKAEQEASEKLAVDKNKGEEQVENLSEVEDPPAKEVFPSNLETKQASRQAPETLPAKPKTTRKRKASLKVETEGVITSQSKRALECKDCGQRFSEVSSLQKHKTMVHIVESPGLTYTNGNIFEGVSTLDIYHLPKQPDKVVGMMNAAADWDTEPEIADLALDEKERSVSFPALIPSPSFTVPPSDVEVIAYENKAADKQSLPSQEVHSPAHQMKRSGMHPILPSEPPLRASTQTKSSESSEPLASDENKQEDASLRNPSTESEAQGTTDEDIKENLLLDVDLVTVGEQNERVETTSQEDSVPQNESSGTCNSEDQSIDKLSGQVSNETTTERSLTSQTVSCSTHQVEIKDEEEELLVQKKKQGGKRAVSRNTTRGRKRGTGRLKRDVISKRASVGNTIGATESEKEQDECQLLYEKRPISSDSEINDEGQPGIRTLQPEVSTEFEADQTTAPTASLSTMPSTLEKPLEEQVVSESDTSADQVTGVRRLEGVEDHNRDANQSPVIILERFLTSRQEATTDKEPGLLTERNNQRKGIDNIVENGDLGSQQIKVEENIADRPLVAPICQNRRSASVHSQHHRDIRTVLVKEESSLVPSEAQTSSRHIRWNVELVNTENISSLLIESKETAMDESCVTPPESITNQCIFYPVKEEEREYLLGAQTNSGNSTTGASCDAKKTEQQATDMSNEGRHSAPGYQEMRGRGLSEPGVGDFADKQAEAEAEMQHPPDLRDFLLQSSDEEDVGVFELSDPQLDSEAEVMAYFYKNPTNCARQHGSDDLSQTMPTSSGQIKAPREETRTREPIDYFSKYFGWDTWVEIANCTNKISNMPRPVTSREVAQFVGFHVAMGTLKYPSPRLYWENLTKVPLVADSMPLSRFLELSRMLKLACPAKDPVKSNVQEGRCDSDFQNAHQGQTLSEIGQRDTPNELSSSKTQTDPLWKVQPLLCRFKAGCHSLRQESDYAVDQYPLHLTGRKHKDKLSLSCTTLIGFGGLLLHVDLKLGQSGREDAVEKMVPKGSMVFLCKQELSTPAMLERLLVAGVHGAGRVGGARGQIGDEFVSSDGKLMLRRSHCGFILSTAGNNQRNMASLMDNFEKAQMSAQLNRDLQNLYSIPLTASAPTCWPQAVLWYLTDLALVNSWLLYKQDHGAVSVPLTLMAFRLEVSKSLIFSNGSDTQDSVPPQPPREKSHATNEKPNPSLVDESPLPDAATRYDGSGHWPEQLEEGEGGRCRYGDCQRTSRVLCLKCCVFLCISRNHNCFLNFHNQGSLGEE
ncbi:hypothetical protein PBY51_017894 [Eleginops maclovinus]|uniref:C2H2-type domain-containing protein n=1 Tax=Eleginops maclovinus TaxID=56733 RepID=A0AAN7XLD9_ELEMC|nr:hypothetical protein PBY51_017894 [Eleginops maclovinus]